MNPPAHRGLGLSSLLDDATAEVTKSTSAADSPHTSSRYSTRVQLRSPFKERHEDSSSENDGGSGGGRCAAMPSMQDSSAIATACPSLPLPFPHRRPPSLSVLQELQARECRSVGVGRPVFQRRTAPHRFGRLELRRSASTYDAAASAGQDLDLLNMQKKSKILEIVAAEHIIFALTHAGVCVAFDCSNMRRLCCLNVISDEVIRSLFFNKMNQCLITVSVYRHDNFTSLRCRSTPFAAIASGKPELGVSLFPGEGLQWPGFVEFDDVNKKVLTFSAVTKKYKVWDLATYALLYELNNPAIDEVKISPGIMLLIFKRTTTTCSLRVVCIDTGEPLQDISYPLAKGSKLQFVEQFNEKLLVKQRKYPLHMVDIQDSAKTCSISETTFAAPSAFIFLFENLFFLTFNKREIAVWNFQGERVTTFEDHFNWWPDCNTNNIFINNAQDLLVSYCLTPVQTAAMHQREVDPVSWANVKTRTGSINISDIFTGRSVAKIEKRQQLKYPFQMLTPAHQQAAIADFKRKFGKARLQQVLGVGVVIEPPTRASETVTDVDPATRALELQQEERSLQMLLQINAQEQQQLHHDAPSTAAPLPSFAELSAAADESSAMEDIDPINDSDELDDDDDGMEESDFDTAMTGLSASDHSSDEERDAERSDRREQQGLINADNVLFPLQEQVKSMPTPLAHQLPATDLPHLPDLAAYRAYNRAVRQRNAALKDVTAVYFNEQRNEIYTGNKVGHIHVWSH